ncbi:hypothetical protein EMIHUDRAFT_250063 [Emiliania huxleyi CCMP1516]|uniref:Uncharacterized protein n=2 Tax=Emiliania huxleyi TaxID=2903 RepID=A0A0D3I450_EMIH1|nr:hypothetical protein EMIHUDRAFT_250063 [Emiliania huxleyi CCMP1516]EOD06035.1 hypothetical protein EMIHUDRAFT_250063 [Emiliania huxleyi CCMP1516]|eukprot:XP_005758464.1 hypothetical protein EMIHUDRAFT_250063 [Emiliania huxleyi CCMP1516]
MYEGEEQPGSDWTPTRCKAILLNQKIKRNSPRRARAHGSLPTARPLIVIMLATILREIDAGIAIFIAVATAILLKECAEAVAGSAGAGDRGSLGIAALLLVCCGYR